MLSKLFKAFSVAAILFVGVNSAHANQSVNIGGEIAEVCEVNVNGGASTATLAMSNTTSDQLIATLNVKCNDPEGFDITLTSTNTCSLLHSGGSFTVAYTATLGTLIGSPTPTNCTAPTNTATQAFSSNFASGENLPLNIRLLTAAAAAGDYSDVLTVTIVGQP